MHTAYICNNSDVIWNRYFFHVSQSRLDSQDYDSADDEAMDEDDEEREPATNMKSDQKMREKSEEANEVDPSFTDWLKVEDDNVPAEADPTNDDSATETDDDSENEDVKAEPEEGSLRDWFDIQPEIPGAGKLMVYLALHNALIP